MQHNNRIMIQSETDMQAFASDFASRLQGNECILLKGDLGAGKTTFARAIIQSLCGNEIEVVSPTFMLVQQYDALPEKGSFSIQHYDLYRIKHSSELLELGIEEALGQALILVEWPEMADGYFPKDAITVEISVDGEKRKISID